MKSTTKNESIEPNERTKTGWKIIYPCLVCVFRALCVCVWGAAREMEDESERIVAFAPLAFAKSRTGGGGCSSFHRAKSSAKWAWSIIISIEHYHFTIVTQYSYPSIHFTENCHFFESMHDILRGEAGTDKFIRSIRPFRWVHGKGEALCFEKCCQNMLSPRNSH